MGCADACARTSTGSVATKHIAATAQLQEYERCVIFARRKAKWSLVLAT
jgi:hypothetical protein